MSFSPVPAGASRSFAYGSHGQLRAVWRLLAFASVFVLAQGVVTAVAEPVLSYTGSKTGGLFTPAELMMSLYTLAAVGIVLRTVDGQPWALVGLDKSSWQLRKVVIGAAFGTTAIVAVSALLFAFGSLQFVRDTTSTWLSGDAVGNSATTAWLLSTLRISLVLLPAALSEELIFRGYLWRVCEDSGSPAIALAITSVLFGVAHLQNPGANVLNIANVILAGFALGFVRQRTGSLPAAWAAHFMWNWFMAAVLHVQVSGLSLATPGYRAEMRGPSWLSGGNWGPEGSVIAAAVLTGFVILGYRNSSFTSKNSNFKHDRLERSASGAH
ncbi:MAG: CPBP family intramembrane metalloprotease [Gemmatimonadota bacterium]|nr:CPBP family intramembrane metalloprotease [Gemmatimonadota bacterium]